MNMSANRIPNHLAWAIIATVVSVCSCCGFLGLFSGIVAIVFAAKVNSAVAVGDIAGAQAASNTAKILCWVTTAFAILGVLYWVWVFATAGVAGFEDAIRQGMEAAKQNR